MRIHISFSILILLIFLLISCSKSGKDSDSISLNSILPKTPKQALSSFEIEPGFSLELVASEPEVVDPIDICWDKNGWMYVAEFRDYPNGPFEGKDPESQIRLLKDLDNDGYYESSIVYADGIHWASSVIPWRDGIFVAAPPDILYYKDTDKDDQADILDTIFTGFGTLASEDIMNNLKLGLDGWVYGAASYNSGDIYNPNHPGQMNSVRRRDFRFHPDSKVFETLSSGRGDFGNCFDDYGRRFVTNATNPLIHIVLPAKYVDRNPYYLPDQIYQSVVNLPNDWIYQISPPEQWRVIRGQNWEQYVNTTHDMRARRYSVKELAEGNYVTGTAGGTIYRGSQYPSPWGNSIFTAEPAANLVIQTAIQSEGSSFTASRPHAEEREFLASTDNWFRPVNFANGPDGCIYICDMYREFIEDPSAIPKDILQHMNMHSGSDRGRIWRLVHSDSPPGKYDLIVSHSGLLEALESQNSWTRETAHRLIIEGEDQTIAPALIELASNSSNPSTKIHTLYLLHILGSLTGQTIGVYLNDPVPAVRENAVILAETLTSSYPFLWKKIADVSTDSDSRVRFQAALSLGTWENKLAVLSLANLAISQPSDPWIQRAILTSSPSMSLDLFESIIKHHKAYTVQLLAQLAQTTGRKNDALATQNLLQILKDHDSFLDDSQHITIVLQLAKGLASMNSSFRDHLVDHSSINEWLDTLEERALANCKITSISTKTRIESVQLLGLGGSTHASNLITLYQINDPTEYQVAIVDALTNLNTADHSFLISAIWPKAVPAVRRVLLNNVMKHQDGIELILLALEDGRIAPSSIPADKKDNLLSHNDSSIKNRAGDLFKIRKRSNIDTLLNRFSQAFDDLEGNGSNGKKIFQSICSTCHRVSEHGHEVGPNLLQTANRSTEGMLIHIIDPDRSVPPEFTTYTITILDNSQFTGIIGEENDNALVLKMPGGFTEQILRNNIADIEASEQSLMPKGLGDNLTNQEMVDLLIFLKKPRI